MSRRETQTDGRFDRFRTIASSVGRRSFGVALGVQLTVATAVAQEGSSTVCGTSVAQGATQTARLLVGILVLGCILVAGLAEGYSRIQRDPNAVADTKDWRNGAAIGSVSTPVIIWLVVQVAGFFSIPVVSCVNLVPYL